MLENKDQSRTSLSQLGEFGLIEHLTKNFTINQESTLKGIGDDAAVLNFGDKKAVISTDLLVEGVHFDLAGGFSSAGDEAFGVYLRQTGQRGGAGAYYSVSRRDTPLPAYTRFASACQRSGAFLYGE